jgi:hypothetical protein
MRTALHQSVRAAYLLVGFPHENRRQSCLSADKWDPFVSYVMLHLGFLINSRAMTVTWPLDKRPQGRVQQARVAVKWSRRRTTTIPSEWRTYAESTLLNSRDSVRYHACAV